MSGPPSTFPPELWLMIIQYLRDEESPQHISRLSQSCKWFQREINHFIYQPVRLMQRANAVSFAEAVEDRPDLKVLVKEVRHDADMGFADFSWYSDSFYEQLSKMKNLQTLAMRSKFRSTDCSWLGDAEDMLYQIYLDPEGTDWSGSILDFQIELDRAGYPDGSFEDPYGIGWDPLAGAARLGTDIVEMTYFCGSYLKDLLPALRTCHIGTDLTQDPSERRLNFFNDSIFTLPQLNKLCITGADFHKDDEVDQRPDSCARSLEELTLLNCRMSVEDLEMILAYPAGLKRFTLRGPYYSDARDFEDDGYTALADSLGLYHEHSLEALDLDIYWGTRAGIEITDMPNLTQLTVTPYSITGIDSEAIADIGKVVQESVEGLTLRHEEGTTLPLSSLYEAIQHDALPNLDTVICQIPDNIQDSPTTSEVRIETEAWKARFEELKVNLSTVLVSYPTTMPKYDMCSCEHLNFYHRFPFHPRAQPLRLYQPIQPANAAHVVPPTQNVPPAQRQTTFNDGPSDDYDPYEGDHPFLYDMSSPPPRQAPHFDDYDDHLGWASGY